MIQGLLHIPLGLPSENGTPLSSPLSSHRHTPYAAVCRHEFSGKPWDWGKTVHDCAGRGRLSARRFPLVLCSLPSTPVTTTRKCLLLLGDVGLYQTLVVRTGTTSYLCISASSKRGKKIKKNIFSNFQKNKAYHPETFLTDITLCLFQFI